MFDPIGAFTKQFTPVEGGYLYYPSQKSGGKLVTTDEYQRMVEVWSKISGRSGWWKNTGIMILVLFLLAFIWQFLSLPDWLYLVLAGAILVGVSGWVLWVSLAPRRLVRERAVITPPRPVSEARRQGRALLNWRFIIFGLIFSGTIFLGSLDVPERDFKSWAWLLGSGAGFISYIWIAIQKFRDG